MLTDGDYVVRMVNLPGDINACLRMDEEDFGNIYINDQLSPEAKKKAFEHECRHIVRGDMDNGKTIRQVEG